MSQSDNWKNELVEQLQQISLATFLKDHDTVTEADALDHLLEISKGQSVKRTAWWPEAVRLHQEGIPVEDIGRRFRTNHRRIRGALSREGLLDIRPEDLHILNAEVDSDAEQVAPTAVLPPPVLVEAIASDDLADRDDDDDSTGEDTPRRRKVVLRKVVQALVPSLRPEPAPLPPPLSTPPTTTSAPTRRVVRPDPIRPEPETEAAPPAPVRRKRRSAKDTLHGSVRDVDPSKIDIAPLLEEELRRPAPRHPLSLPVRPPVAPAPVAQAPAEAAPAPSAAPPRVSPRVSPRVPPAARPQAPVASAPPAAVPVKRTGKTMGWRLRLNGKEQPLVVVADNILRAAQLFAARLGPDALVCADIYPSPLLD